MRNWNIRKKLAPLYLIIAFFTFFMFFVVFFALQGQAQLAAQVAAGTADAAAVAQQGASQTSFLLWMFPLYLVIYFVCIFTVGRMVAKQVAFPAKDLMAAAEKIASGDVDIVLEHRAKDELGKLTDSFRTMVASVKDQASVLQEIAQGDYTATIKLRGPKDVVNKAIADMLENNNRVFTDVRNAAQQVAMGSGQISSGAQTLATGSTQQAATLQQFSATVGQLHSQAEGTTQLAGETLDDVNEAGRLMGESMQYMAEMAEAMQAIESSSKEIAKVIKVIDDIAFQTNILALNAAVEAARAGQHGKGFAVVADEVRNLASKSAEAAKETAALIDSSVQNVARGGGIAEKTSESLRQVGEIAGGNATAMGQVSEASQQQSAAIHEINQGITQISQVVQANSATAEQSAAGAEELSAQAEMLNRVVSRFRLRQGTAPGGLPAAPAPPAAALPPVSAGGTVIF